MTDDELRFWHWFHCIFAGIGVGAVFALSALEANMWFVTALNVATMVHGAQAGRMGALKQMRRKR